MYPLGISPIDSFIFDIRLITCHIIFLVFLQNVRVTLTDGSPIYFEYLINDVKSCTWHGDYLYCSVTPGQRATASSVSLRYCNCS